MPSHVLSYVEEAYCINLHTLGDSGVEIQVLYCLIGCTDDEQQVAGVGLVASHAYSLLTACELEAPQGTIR